MHTTSFPPPHSVFPSSLCIMSVYVLLGSNMYCSEYDQSTRRQELIEGDEFSLFWSDLQRFFSNFPTSWLHTLRIYEKKMETRNTYTQIYLWGHVTWTSGRPVTLLVAWFVLVSFSLEPVMEFPCKILLLLLLLLLSLLFIVVIHYTTQWV